jgi:hypothetical protein
LGEVFLDVADGELAEMKDAGINLLTIATSANDQFLRDFKVHAGDELRVFG